MRTYLVTGGAGFIGSNIAARLAQDGADVVVCDWLRTDERWRNLAHHEIADVIAPEALPHWLGRHGIGLEAVVHMGANSSTTETDADLIYRQNSRATLDLIEWCTQHSKRLIYASSAATYGDGSAGFDDAPGSTALARLRPLNAYGWSKHLVDRRLTRLSERRAPLPAQVVGLKFFNVYGPNEWHKGGMQSVVARNFPAVERGEPVRLFRSGRPDYPDGGQQRDFIYVRDCVEVVSWLLANPQVSGIFNVGSGQARTWLDLARALFAACGRPERIEFIDMPPQLAGKYQYFTEARMERLRHAGYAQPFTSLEDGVQDYVRTYLRAGDPYR